MPRWPSGRSRATDTFDACSSVSALACRFSIEQSGGLENTDLDGLDRFLRRQLHNRDGYRQPLDLVLDRLVS